MGIRRTDAPPARTPEERERAREERERRRGRVAPAAPEPAASEPEAQAEPSPDPQPPPPEPQPALDLGLQSMPEPEPPPTADLGPPTMPEPDPVPMTPPVPDPEPLPEPEGPEPELAAAGPRLHPPHLHRPRVHRPHVHRRHLHRPHLHRPHLHRPHLHRPHVRRGHSLLARIGALAALLVVLGLVGVGAFVVERAIRHKPIEPLATVRVVVPEGSTRAQIAAIARARGLKGDYLKASGGSTQLSPQRYGAPARERSLEGFLFPATYELYAGSSAGTLLSKQLSAFSESFSSTDRRRAKALGVSPYQLLIVASIVEREASLTRERPLVAAVIYNRLHRNMPLGIDATIRYALHNDYTHPLTEAQLHSSSPYNTRTHTGLPPTPISNPGLASIEAAANPARVSYLYYVARPDGCPGQVFSSSYTQFERDASAYQQALRSNHGNVPRCTHR